MNASHKILWAIGILLVVGLFLAVAFAAYLKGRRDVHVEDMKIYYSCLNSRFADKESPLYAFWKGRYYYVSRSVPDARLQSYYTDFGPIEKTLIGSVPTGKDGNGSDEDYHCFVQRKP